MTLEFKVTGQHIAWVNNTAHVVADSRNYLRAAFELSEEWTYPVTALFKGGCKTVPVLLAQAGEEITVPPEVLKAPLMLVSCYCGDLITADSARVKIDPSGYTEDTSPPVPPTPDLYQKLIEQYKAYVDSKIKETGDGATFIPSVDAEGNLSWTNDKGKDNPPAVNIRGPQGKAGTKGEIGPPGADGYTPVRGVDYWTDTDQAAIVTAVIDALPDAAEVKY